MANVSFLPLAEQDYQEGLAWYLSRSAQAAAGFEAAVEIALMKISADPEMYPLCDERHRFYGMRRYPYCLIYRINQGEILVVAVAHARRSPRYWQER